jgi:hypothetical protein
VYSVTGTDANGCNNSAVFTQSVDLCTNILSNDEGSEEIKLFPNPTSGVLNIVSKKLSQGMSVEVFNVLGQRIFSQNVAGENFVIDINGYSNSFYLVKVVAGDRSSIFKIIKE